MYHWQQKISHCQCTIGNKKSHTASVPLATKYLTLPVYHWQQKISLCQCTVGNKKISLCQCTIGNKKNLTLPMYHRQQKISLCQYTIGNKKSHSASVLLTTNNLTLLAKVLKLKLFTKNYHY